MILDISAMSGLLRGFDASEPPQTPYPGCQVVCGYIGGATPHVWSLREWQRFGALLQAPIWVLDTSPGALTALEQGIHAADAAAELGWETFAHTRSIIWLDMETMIEPVAVDNFAEAVWRAGYCTGVYGSAGNILSDPKRDGYWIALWDDRPADDGQLGHQYQADVAWDGTLVDLSVFDSSAAARFGRGPRG